MLQIWNMKILMWPHPDTRHYCHKTLVKMSAYGAFKPAHTSILSSLPFSLILFYDVCSSCERCTEAPETSSWTFSFYWNEKRITLPVPLCARVAAWRRCEFDTCRWTPLPTNTRSWGICQNVSLPTAPKPQGMVGSGSQVLVAAHWPFFKSAFKPWN